MSGGNGLGTGTFDESLRETTIKDMVEKHKFGHKKQEQVREGTMAEMDPEVVSSPSSIPLRFSTLPCLALPSATE